MRKLPEVEDAKALMNAAMDWSVFTWLWEKKSVRTTADKANAVLDRLNRKIKSTWHEDLMAAYQQLVAECDCGGSSRQPARQLSPVTPAIAPEIKLLARKVKDADDAAHRARMDAEATFDEADRQLSVRLAREGCQKAIRSWELHEKAIRKAEAALEVSKCSL
jgi:hypothetical protein